MEDSVQRRFVLHGLLQNLFPGGYFRPALCVVQCQVAAAFINGQQMALGDRSSNRELSRETV